MKSNEHFMQMLLGLSEWETGREQKIGIQDIFYAVRPAM